MFTKGLSLLGLLGVLVLSPVAGTSGFCEGYKAGYKAGYCYREFACIPPLPPLCPLPELGETTYQDGYNRGFLNGLNRR